MNAKKPISEVIASHSRLRIIKTTDILKLIFFKRLLNKSEYQTIEEYKEKLYKALDCDANNYEISDPRLNKGINHTVINIKQKFNNLLSSEGTSKRNLLQPHITTEPKQVIVKKQPNKTTKIGPIIMLRMIKNRTLHLINSSANKIRFISKARKRLLVKVPLELCTNQYGFSYRQSGWHYWKDMVRSFAERSDPIEKHRWYQFIKHVSQPSYTKLMTFHHRELSDKLVDIPFGSYPWGPCGKDVAIDPSSFHDQTFNRATQNYIWYETGHTVDQVCIKEFKHSMSILYSVLARGYCFLNFRDLPRVKVLQKNNGDIRFVSIDGAHRLGILSALGFEHVIVELDLDQFPVAHEADIDNWVYVKSGLINKTDALKLFELYFTLDGSERVDHLF